MSNGNSFCAAETPVRLPWIFPAGDPPARAEVKAAATTNRAEASPRAGRGPHRTRPGRVWRGPVPAAHGSPRQQPRTLKALQLARGPQDAAGTWPLPPRCAPSRPP